MQFHEEILDKTTNVSCAVAVIKLAELIELDIVSFFTVIFFKQERAYEV